MYPITPADETERALLIRYLDRKLKDVELLDAAVAQQDYERAHRIGHNLAGSGAAFGFWRITSIGRQIEAAAAREAAAELAPLIGELRSFLDSIRISS